MAELLEQRSRGIEGDRVRAVDPDRLLRQVVVVQVPNHQSLHVGVWVGMDREEDPDGGAGLRGQGVGGRLHGWDRGV